LAVIATPIARGMTSNIAGICIVKFENLALITNTTTEEKKKEEKKLLPELIFEIIEHFHSVVFVLTAFVHQHCPE
jgi:hypothetical protein